MTFMDYLTIILIVLSVMVGNALYDLLKWSTKEIIKDWSKK